MLDKLKLSKFLLVLLICSVYGCKTFKSDDEQITAYNTKVVCPNGVKLLVIYANALDIRKGIEQALFTKRKSGTSERYTVVRLPGKRSFKIEKLLPEEALKCSLTEFTFKTKRGNYKIYVPE